MYVKLDKFQIYSSIPSYIWIFWHLYNGLLRFTTHFKAYLVKIAKFFEQN